MPKARRTAWPDLQREAPPLQVQGHDHLSQLALQDGSPDDPIEGTQAAAKHMNPSIHKLPQEILIKIFRALVEWHASSLTGTHSDSWPYGMGFYTVPLNRGWTSIMLVCKYWRTLVRDSPFLWTTIVVRGNLKWLDLALARSGTMPLDIRVAKREALTTAFPTILSCSNRLRILHLVNLGQVDILPITTFLSSEEFPQLEELSVHGEAFGDSIVLSLDKARVPALHTLKLSSAFVSLECPLVSTLRVLDLSRLTLHPDLEALDDLLSALQKCTSLQDLRLDWGLPHKWRGQSDRMVTLPNLRHLRIVSPTDCNELEPHAESNEVLYTFLQHLCLPLHADIVITADLDGEPEGYDFLPFIPQDVVSLPILGHATSATFGRTWFQCTVAGGWSGRLRVELDNASLDNEAYYLHPQDELLNGFCTLLSQAPLKELAIVADRMSSQGLVAAFHSFQAISRLDFYVHSKSNKAIDHLITALRVTDLPPEVTVVPLPELRSLRVVGARGLLSSSEKTRVEQLKRLAAARAGRGAKLEEMSIEEAVAKLQVPFSTMEFLEDDSDSPDESDHANDESEDPDPVEHDSFASDKFDVR